MNLFFSYLTLALTRLVNTGSQPSISGPARGAFNPMQFSADFDI